LNFHPFLSYLMKSVKIVFRALSDETRMEILLLLKEKDKMKVGDISGRFPTMSEPAISKHLKELTSAGLVEFKKEGPIRWYKLNIPAFEEAFDWLARLGVPLSALRSKQEIRKTETDDQLTLPFNRSLFHSEI
jgi:DNA-binding transcriptional ArsR family regulator